MTAVQTFEPPVSGLEGDGHGALVEQIELFARSITADEPSPRIVDLILDGLGVAIAGRGAPAATAVDRVLGRSALPWDRAWAHGVRMHALDFDDTHEPSLCHSGTALAPGILALAFDTGASGRDVLAAYDMGLRVIDLLSVAGFALNTLGVHSTAVVGGLGASAACGWLLTRDAARTADALEIGATLVAGLAAAFGTDTKPLQAGHAAEIGLRAASFAAAGVEAPRGAALGSGGVIPLWLRDTPRLTWGSPRADAAMHVAVKPYPSCFLTHSTIDAMLELRERLGPRDPADVAHVDLTTHPLAIAISDKTALDTMAASKFSLRYCALAALADGAVGVDTFSQAAEARLSRAAGSWPGWADRFTMVAADDSPPLRAAVQVTLADGRSDSLVIAAPRGSLQRPLTCDEVQDKFRSNAAGRLPGSAVEQAISDVLGLAAATSVAELQGLRRAWSVDGH